MYWFSEWKARARRAADVRPEQNTTNTHSGREQQRRKNVAFVVGWRARNDGHIHGRWIWWHWRTGRVRERKRKSELAQQLVCSVCPTAVAALVHSGFSPVDTNNNYIIFHYETITWHTARSVAVIRVLNSYTSLIRNRISRTYRVTAEIYLGTVECSLPNAN